jgi:hypothetical protein
MKKILFSTITFLSLVALASCGEKDKTTSTGGTIYDTTTFVPTTTLETTTEVVSTTTTLETTTKDESTTVDTTTGNTTSVTTPGNTTSVTTTGDTTSVTTTGNTTSVTTPGDTTNVTTTSNTTSVTTTSNTTNVTTTGNTTSVTTTGNTTSVTTTSNTTSVTTPGDTTSVTTPGDTTSVTTPGDTTSVTTTGNTTSVTTSVTTTGNTDTTTTSSQTTTPTVVDYGSISGNSYKATIFQETFSEQYAPMFEPYIGSVITFREDGIFEWPVDNYPGVGDMLAIGNWYQKDDGSFTYIQRGVIEHSTYHEMPEVLQVERAIDLTEKGIILHSYYNASETDYGDLHLEAVLTENPTNTYSYWEKTTYDEIKTFYLAKKDLLWDKVKITFESVNDDMVSHVGTFELANEVWTLKQHNDEFDWTHYYPSTYLPTESDINELETTPSHVTMTYEKFRNHYRITAYADIPEQNRVVTTIIEMDEYFAVTYQTQIVNGQTVMKALNTWSTKEE